MGGSAHPQLVLTFLIGLIAGGAFRWGYIRLLQATIRSYEYYIQERIDKQQGELFAGYRISTGPVTDSEAAPTRETEP